MLVSTIGCRDSTGPTRQLVELSEFDVPAIAAGSDTIRIAFSYARDCDVPSVLETRVDATSVTIAAWTNERGSGGAPCLDLPAPRAELRLLPLEHRGAITVTFRQPGGVDSVRVIAPTGD